MFWSISCDFNFFFISSINLVWLRLISYLLFWITSSPKYLNILTFSVTTENKFRRGSITICLKFSVPLQQKSSTCVINKPCNSVLKCQKNNAGSKRLHLSPSLSNSSLTRKYQFLEASDRSYIQVFDVQTISFSSNSAGGVKYTTPSISFPCKKADFISMELCPSVGCHDHENKSKTFFSAGRWVF